MTQTIALVGCGAMGSSLLHGWLTEPCSAEKFERFFVIAPHKEKVTPFLSDPRVTWLSSPQDLKDEPDLLVFALKPFQLEDVLPEYTRFTCPILSVASGKPLTFYERFFNPGQAILRAMPNIPVRIHQGVVALLANKSTSQEERYLVEDCFGGLGYCPWVSSDEDIDKVTALSGSGPAYVYLMIEALAEAGVSFGFDEETATDLALHTFVGASLYALESEHSPATLREHVTSPQGTTAAALRVFEEGKLKPLIQEGVDAALNRARELSK